jgi:hypothetical protein
MPSASPSDVRKPEAFGYSYQGEEWAPSSGVPAAAGPLILVIAESDAMHSALVERADAFEGCTEVSEEEAELISIVDAIEAYEAVRWPQGKVNGGKG